MDILTLKKMKAKGKKISVITCYDYTFAKIIDETDINCILVGDSLGMVMLGSNTTLGVSIEQMEMFTKSVIKGAPNKFIISDLPFLSYRKDLKTTMDNVQKIMKTGAHAVKLEGVFGNEATISHIVQSGVPVMGHIGLTPQSVNQLGGFRVQGKGKNTLIKQAKILEDCGCFSIVIECVPSDLSAKITEFIKIPTIGIGAGSRCDGQVLVLQDLLGMNKDFKPKFVRKFMDGFLQIKDAINDYDKSVKNKKFPSKKESF